MGTDIHGYIEVNIIDLSDEDCWFKVIDIGILAERNYEIFGGLFGVRAKSEKYSLAISRGVPHNTSDRDDLNENEEGIVGHMWATWQEIDSFLPKLKIDPESHGWLFLLRSMESLAKIIGSENLKIVVAFDNYG